MVGQRTEAKVEWEPGLLCSAMEMWAVINSFDYSVKPYFNDEARALLWVVVVEVQAHGAEFAVPGIKTKVKVWSVRELNRAQTRTRRLYHSFTTIPLIGRFVALHGLPNFFHSIARFATRCATIFAKNNGWGKVHHARRLSLGRETMRFGSSFAFIRESEVAHLWAKWLRHPCRLGDPHRCRAGGKIRSRPQVGEVATSALPSRGSPSL